ncbi:hypothetical protein [Flavobacterium cheniae]|uniref:Outer membrane protein with beta-barrel domain n=1 Tax=Flavobacterium cheniae TaxID=295428 RepID=A0A562KH97_9FLAO|nr:hypothetical protein [Flavobacterium cheniae]TDR24497.1 hypothetical protein C8D80_1538 [Flavobacterium cheniae]TWH94752.1 hypothetical protein IP97_01464 [Flavobacterium cheniae]
MKDNKNIERLFQEKFKDFEALPPQDSWDIIASRLNEKKKKKRIVPIWFEFSGIAASLFIIGSLIWNFSGESNTTEVPNSNNTIVNTEDSKGNSNNSNITSPNNEAIVYDSQSNEENLDKKSNNSINQYNEKSIDEKLVKSKLKNNSSRRNGLVSNGKLQNDIDASSNQKGFKKGKNNFKKQSSSVTNSEKALVANTEKNKAKRKSKSKSNKNNSDFENLFDDNNVVDNNREDKNAINKETIDAFFENKTSNTTTITNNDSITKQTNNSDVVVSNEIITQDSTLVAEVSKETNLLEELLKEKEAGKNEDEKEEKRSKWAISTNASPVYFNSLAQGSSIDQQFDSNSKNYATTLSLGIAGSYAINNKLSLKTGVNNINISYNTNDVLFDARMNNVENNIPTISRNPEASNMVFSSKVGNVETLSGDVENVIIENNVGALQQNISYIEVPLELSYKLLDKKFGIEVIGGMSTLFLNQNNISLVANGIEMEVGRANNLNNIHFSSNVGLGFKYNFWKSFNANFQPMFKYQINTFSENSGNFKPYFIGLYTGVSFSF